MSKSRWCRLLLVALSSACGGEDGSGDGGTTGSGSETGAGPTTSADGSATGSDATTAPGTSTSGGSADTTGDAETGTTGGPDEGEFADVYRVAFRQSAPGVAEVVWSDVGVSGPSPTVALLPGDDSGVFLSLSPSGRWMVVAGTEGWVVDTSKVGAGAPEDWTLGLGLPLFGLDTVYLPGEDGLAYRAPDVAATSVYARTLGDTLGPPVIVGPGGAGLAIFDDQLIFESATGEIHLAPAAVMAGTSEPVATFADPSPLGAQLWLSDDGAAVYAREGDQWWIGAVDPLLPADLDPISLLPEQPGIIRISQMAPTRRRLWTFDFDYPWESPEPLSYVALDGAVASTPVVVPIPSGPDGTIIGVDPQLSADAEKIFVAGTTSRAGRAAYSVDASVPDTPTLTALAGPGIDEQDVTNVLLSHDEERLYYATLGNPRRVMMVSLVGDPTPLDLAPGFQDAFGRAGSNLVESEDGRAVYFIGRDGDLDPPLPYRVGIVDGVPTAPVAMADGLGSLSLPRFWPAPDGGALAFTRDDQVWVSVYGDGMPAAFQVSDRGLVADSLGWPTFFPLPP